MDTGGSTLPAALYFCHAVIGIRSCYEQMTGDSEAYLQVKARAHAVALALLGSHARRLTRMFIGECLDQVDAEKDADHLEPCGMEDSKPVPGYQPSMRVLCWQAAILSTKLTSSSCFSGSAL